MKIRKHFVVIFCLLLFMLFVSSETAQACTCKPNETVDKEFKKIPNVAVLTLQSVELLNEKTEGGGNIWHSKFKIDRTFKGNLKSGDELIFINNYSSCGWSFSEDFVGTKYIFYLDEKPVKENIWQVSPCSKSGSIQDKADDLLYLEKMEKVKNKTRLSGSVGQFISEMTIQGKLGKWNHLFGRKIRLVGNGKNIELKTDENGVYEVYDLLPGKYKITLEKINGYSFTNDNSDSVEVEITAKSHTEKDIFYSIRNAIRGRLFDADGKPLKDVKLELIPANEDFPKFYIADGYTDENGNFEFTGIPIGTFLIVVNKDNEFNSDERFGTFYYPGTINRVEASEITISPGVFYENFNIKVPRAAENTKSDEVKKNKGLENEQ